MVLILARSYLTELRNIAVNRRLMSSGTMTRMKRSAVLLGSRRVRKNKGPVTIKKQPDDLGGELEEEDWEYQYDLLPPDQVVIADETNAYQLFGDVIFTAPQEDLLEGSYVDQSVAIQYSQGIHRVLPRAWLQTA